MSEQLRKEFEAWAEAYGHDISRSETNPDEYHDLITELAFDVWKSAHADPEREAEPVAAPAGYFCEPYLNKPGLFEQVFNGFDDPDVIPLYRDPAGTIAALERENAELREALAAIKARLNGEYDHPALLNQGALGEFRDDVERIIEQMNHPEREAQSEESSARSAQALLADVREGGSPLTEVLVDVARYWHTGSYKIARDELYATINHFSHDILQITETKLASKARSSADLNEVSHDQQF